MARHLILAGEKALVCLDGGLGQLHAVRALGEAVVRLVEADMAVAADTEQLNIHIAHTAKHRIIAGALLFSSGSMPFGRLIRDGSMFTWSKSGRA